VGPTCQRFPFFRNTQKWLSAQEKWLQGEKKSEKIPESRKSKLEHFSLLPPPPIIPRF
jgi:hypothetical protein